MSQANCDILVLGDSIQWGQGLKPQSKMYFHTKKWLEQRNRGITVRVASAAHSGAIIGVGNKKKVAKCVNGKVPNGEVPNGLPTILDQVSSVNDPERFGVVIVDGGINDVSVSTILNPTTTLKTLRNLSKRHCGDDMVCLLREIVKRFPKAHIVVTGYYPIVSKYTLIWKFMLWIPAAFPLLMGPILALGPWVVIAWRLYRRRATKLSSVFATSANTNLLNSVNLVNQTREADHRIAFANPQFGPTHAVFAKNSLLWDLNILGQPVDQVKAARFAECKKCTSPVGTDRVECNHASIGHPNVAGAHRYSNKINQGLKNMGY